MASLLGMIGKGKRGQQKAVNAILTAMDRDKAPVRMELEQTNIRFTTMLVYKTDSVVVAKPTALEESLKKGQHVRFKVPGDRTREISMEIVSPHFNLNNGRVVFICTPPTGFAESTMRDAERFDTRRFSNLHLKINQFEEPLRIVDLSIQGCRVLVNHPNPNKVLPVGQIVSQGIINMGNKAQVELNQIIPRMHRGQEVGIEFAVSGKGSHQRMLDNLLTLLDRKQKEDIRSERL